MDKELATRALDEAFVSHVSGLFEDLSVSYEGDEAASPDAFLKKFHAAMRAHEAATRALEVSDAHAKSGPEDDVGYRARIANTRNSRGVMGPAQLRGLSGADLDAYGVQVGVPRGVAKWNPPPPPKVDDAKKNPIKEDAAA